jgi:hypothetical protein
MWPAAAISLLLKVVVRIKGTPAGSGFRSDQISSHAASGWQISHFPTFSTSNERIRRISVAARSPDILFSAGRSTPVGYAQPERETIVTGNAGFKITESIGYVIVWVYSKNRALTLLDDTGKRIAPTAC